ncbi:EexN family lipoprotein [Sphingomonas sp. BAUL-RG-20F-R05-02]|uniref:EexN family lipoprotein n=1 Tax=Sphingomonas sp. BAUL-RG-20F-R05-02 TaxID=2914830 RepID=UPI00391F2F69
MSRLIFLVLAVGIGACSPTAQPVNYYKSHPAILEKRLTECVAQFEQSKDCINAKTAYLEVHHLPIE